MRRNTSTGRKKSAEGRGPAAGRDVATTDELAELLMQWMTLSMKASRARGVPETVRILSDVGATMPMVAALHLLVFEGPQTMTRLTELLGLSASATSHMLQRLVELGLCERTEDPVDRRQKLVAISTRGRDVVGNMMKARFAELRSSIEPLSPRTRDRLARVLRIVIDELSGGDPPRCPAGFGTHRKDAKEKP